jgi:hypothetical protein
MKIKPSQEARDEAKKNPNGWVYKIDGNFAAREAVPPERIIGAWKVDERGNITGAFIPNPNYRLSKPN